MSAAALKIGDQLILEEEYDENYIPSEQEIQEYAREIGIDPDKEPELLWLAREGIVAPLPAEWKPCQDVTGDIYYFNFSSGQSTWDHPCDEQYRQLVQQERERAQPHTSKTSTLAGKKEKKKKDKKEKKGKKKEGAKPSPLGGMVMPLSSGLGSLGGPLSSLAPLRGLGLSSETAIPPLRGSLLGSEGRDSLRTSLGGPVSSLGSSLLEGRLQEKPTRISPDLEEEEDKLSDQESPSGRGQMMLNLHLDLDDLGKSFQYEDSEASISAPPEELTEPELRDIGRDHSPDPGSQDTTSDQKVKVVSATGDVKRKKSLDGEDSEEIKGNKEKGRTQKEKGNLKDSYLLGLDGDGFLANQRLQLCASSPDTSLSSSAHIRLSPLRGGSGLGSDLRKSPVSGIGLGRREGSRLGLGLKDVLGSGLGEGSRLGSGLAEGSRLGLELREGSRLREVSSLGSELRKPGSSPEPTRRSPLMRTSSASSREEDRSKRKTSDIQISSRGEEESLSAKGKRTEISEVDSHNTKAKAQDEKEEEDEEEELEEELDEEVFEEEEEEVVEDDGEESERNASEGEISMGKKGMEKVEVDRPRVMEERFKKTEGGALKWGSDFMKEKRDFKTADELLKSDPEEKSRRSPQEQFVKRVERIEDVEDITSRRPWGLPEKHSPTFLLKAETKRFDDEEEMRRLREESDAKIRMLRQQLDVSRREEESRVREEESRLRADMTQRLQELRDNNQRERELQQRLISEENASCLRELQRRLEEERRAEQGRLEEQQRRELSRLQEEAELNLLQEKRQLHKRQEEALGSIKLEARTNDMMSDVSSSSKQQLADYRTELTDVLQEIREELQRDHSRRVEQAKEEQRQKLEAMRLEHVEQVRQPKAATPTTPTTTTFRRLRKACLGLCATDGPGRPAAPQAGSPQKSPQRESFVGLGQTAVPPTSFLTRLQKMCVVQ
ncbi:centrosomal protein of 164 kDa-like [Engraulis encrasicolus]|uniref:centrosomal protein of 164 kDa-like n=1 Tax=Engraulis encrasicolus TaxID=184585 RepID=UPI002FCEA7AB